MASTFSQTKEDQTSLPQRTNKVFFIGQVAVRTIGIAFTLIAIGLMVTTKQTIMLFGLPIDAKFSYEPTLKFYVGVYSVACVLTLLSLSLFLYSVRLVNPGTTKYFTIFFIDLIFEGLKSSEHYFKDFLWNMVVMVLGLIGSAAATSIGYLGRYGNKHTGWASICGQFGKFCNRTQASLIFSYIATALFIVTTVWSAWKSTRASR